jgi:hypothetical protein
MTRSTEPSRLYLTFDQFPTVGSMGWCVPSSLGPTRTQRMTRREPTDTGVAPVSKKHGMAPVGRHCQTVIGFEEGLACLKPIRRRSLLFGCSGTGSQRL